MKKVVALILSLCFILSLGVIPASAEEAVENEKITIIIHNENISEETKEKLIAFYSDTENQDNSTIYGLTCTLFGHKLESTMTTVITHKVRATAPRCQQKKYNYESCTRCDYENSTLANSTYINCCA
jgi:hypothetical protein